MHEPNNPLSAQAETPAPPRKPPALTKGGTADGGDPGNDESLEPGALSRFPDGEPYEDHIRQFRDPRTGRYVGNPHKQSA